MDGFFGWTGINPEFAKKNINDFDEASRAAVKALTESFRYLFSELKYIWCSPKAKDFSDKYNVRCGDFCAKVKENFNNICISATNAFNIVARANNLPQLKNQFSSSHTSNWGGYGYATGNGDYVKVTFIKEIFTQLVDKHPDTGIVGMNTQAVALVLREFENKMREAINLLDSLPTEIALFDTENMQKFAFKEIVEKTSAEVEQLASIIERDIKNAMNEETNQVILASKSATDTIKSVQV